MNTVKKYYVALLCVLFLAACSKNETDDLVIDNSIELNDLGLESVENEDLPAKVAEQLKLSNQNFDSYLDGDLQYVSHKVLGKATEEKALENAIDLSLRDESILSVGNLMEPSTINISTLQKVRNKSGKDQKSVVANMAKSTAKKGDLVFELTWNYRGESLKTIALGNENGITWDNMLSGMVLIDKPEIGKQGEGKITATERNYRRDSTRNWIIRYVWGTKRGEMGYLLRIIYDSSSRRVIVADMQDWAVMNWGSGLSESQVTTTASSYAQGRYALGVATSGGSISFDNAGFKVTSNYGSTHVENGTTSVFVP
ncbi:hypothetical protein [Maribacter sp. 2-571]|uniref:hypothetical protein n=1 Tax=Maribacter sp. 2-571 TaxID=3417569 RepID=UPI003D33DA4E